MTLVVIADSVGPIPLKNSYNYHLGPNGIWQSNQEPSAVHLTQPRGLDSRRVVQKEEPTGDTVVVITHVMLNYEKEMTQLPSWNCGGN